MTIYSNRKEADNLTGKVLVCKNRHYDYNSKVGNSTKEWAPGELILILSHEKNARGASWQGAKEVLHFFLHGVGGTLVIDSAFDANWGLIEPEDILHGASFVFTGALQNTRDYYKCLVEMFGGVFSGSVTSKTKYLVMADKNSMTTKAQKARENGTKLIDEREFLNLLKTSL